MKGGFFGAPAASRGPTTDGTKVAATAVTVILACALAADGALAAGRGGSGGGGRSDGQHSGKSHSGHHRYHHNRSAVAAGVFVSAPWWPWWNFPPYYPPVAIAAGPVAYIERGEQEAQSAGEWLYCAKTQGYFPYVAECAEGWERVPVTPLK